MTDTDGTAGAPLSTDRAFDLLRNPRRRRAVAVLRERDGAVPLRDLAHEIVERAPDASTPDRPSEARDRPSEARDRPSEGRDRPSEGRDHPSEGRDRVAASLHHCHLPKLDDAGVVEYDPAASVVAATPVAEELEPFFEAIDSPASGWGVD